MHAMPPWFHAAPADIVWLDADHVVVWRAWPGETEPHGGELWHRRAQSPDGWCVGSWFVRQPQRNGVPYAQPIPLWTLDSRDPLTLNPSFQCHCGEHGFIRNGKWVPA